MRADPEPEDRVLAVLMGTHKRLGRQSPLLGLDEALVAGLIAQRPVVERPIRLFREAHYHHHDDFIVTTHPHNNGGGQRTPFVCTVSDGARVVFRAPIMRGLDAHAFANFVYASAPRRHQRVRFCVILLPTRPQPARIGPLVGAIMETLHTEPRVSLEILQDVRYKSAEELLAFRARNALGVQLRLSFFDGGAVTPLITTDDEA